MTRNQGTEYTRMGATAPRGHRSWRRAPPHGARRSAGSLFQAAADGAAAARGAARTRGSASIAAASPAAGVFVSPDWLQRNLEQVVVFDARGRVAVGEAGADGGGQEVTYIADYDAYLAGHISGASFINWTVDGVDASSDVPVQLQVDPGQFASDLERKGLTADKAVVVYDDGDGLIACRVWWALTCHGHPRVHVLEGGWARWAVEGRPTSLHEPCPLKVYATFDVDQPKLQHRVTAEEVLSVVSRQQQGRGGGSSGSSAGAGGGSGGGHSTAPASNAAGGGDYDVIILDIRTKEQYDGVVQRGPRAGRIPGSVSLPRALLLDPAGATGSGLKPVSELRELFAAAGVRFNNQVPSGGGSVEAAAARHSGSSSQQRVVLYCNGGVAACTAAVALQELGVSSWTIYDGSWNEWGARPELPVEAPS